MYLSYGTGPNVAPTSLQPSNVYAPFVATTYNPFSATAAAQAVGTEAKGEASDLHLPLRDVRRGLRRAPGSTLGPQGSQSQGPAGAGEYWVPLFRVAQFLRQAGLLPRIMSKLITELMRETEECYSHVPMSQMTPWWWPRTTRAMPTIPGGYGAFRRVRGCIEARGRSCRTWNPCLRLKNRFGDELWCNLHLTMCQAAGNLILAYKAVAQVRCSLPRVCEHNAE